MVGERLGPKEALGETSVALFERDPNWHAFLDALTEGTSVSVTVRADNMADAWGSLDEVRSQGIQIAFLGHLLPTDSSSPRDEFTQMVSTGPLAVELRKKGIHVVGLFGETANVADMPEVDAVLLKTDPTFHAKFFLIITDPSYQPDQQPLSAPEVVERTSESDLYHAINSLVGLTSGAHQLSQMEGRLDGDLKKMIEEKIPIQFAALMTRLATQPELLERGYNALLERSRAPINWYDPNTATELLELLHAARAQYKEQRVQ